MTVPAAQAAVRIACAGLAPVWRSRSPHNDLGHPYFLFPGRTVRQGRWLWRATAGPAGRARRLSRVGSSASSLATCAGTPTSAGRSPSHADHGTACDTMQRITQALFGAKDTEPVMLIEILVILEIQRCERHLVGQAARRDPHVVDRTAAADRRPPDRGHGLVAGQHGNMRQPARQFLATAGTQVADLCPLGQLTEGDEGISGSRPMRRVASGAVSWRRCSSEATSVSRTVGCTGGGQARSR